VEFAATIPPKLKLKNRTRKYLLRNVATRYLPREIINLPKQGFGSPINTWLRGELQGLSHGLLRQSLLVKHGLFNKTYIQSLLDDHSAQKINNGNKIWSLVNLESWYRIHFGNQTPKMEKENLKTLFLDWSKRKNIH
jgi:asparagine synthase (glutamine-hydrolysing)